MHFNEHTLQATPNCHQIWKGENTHCVPQTKQGEFTQKFKSTNNIHIASKFKSIVLTMIPIEYTDALLNL